jgi:hypothetical protein
MNTLGILVSTLAFCVAGMAGGGAAEATRVSIDGNRWRINGVATHPGTPAEGLLLNVRMVNAVFEDRRRAFSPAHLPLRERKTRPTAGAPKGQRDNSPGQGPPACPATVQRRRKRSAGGAAALGKGPRTFTSPFFEFCFSTLQARKNKTRKKERYSR